MIPTAFILAQAEAAGGSPITMFIPMILIMLMMYFLMIRPQRQRQKALDAMISKLGTGDKVVSAGGIHGSVTSVKDKTVMVKIADNTKIEFEKSSIAQVLRDKSE